MRILTLAILAMMIALPAWGANISVFRDKTNPTETTRISFTTNHAIDTISDAIPSCPGMEVVFDQGAAADVSLYAVGSGDNTVAEVEAGTLLKAFTASTTTPVSIKPGTQFVRFVVDTAETGSNSVAEVRCSNVIASGVIETAPSASTGLTDGDSVIMTGLGTDNNFIDPDAINAMIFSTCGTTRPCIIGGTATTACVDNFSTCTDLFDATCVDLFDGAGVPQVGGGGADGLCDFDGATSVGTDRGSPQFTGSPDRICDSDGVTDTIPQSVGSADGLCDLWGVAEIAATGPVPAADATFTGYGGAWPLLPAYPLKDGRANYSAILPGSYDAIIQSQAGIIGGNHNLMGPQSGVCVDLYDTGGPPQTSGSPDNLCDADGSIEVLGGTGHGAIIGSNNLIAGENQDVTVIGFSNAGHLATALMFPTSAPAEGNVTIGKGNVQDSRTVTPTSAQQNIWIGTDNTVTGAVRESFIAGKGNVITGDTASGQTIMQNIYGLGSLNGRVTSPSYQAPYNFPSSINFSGKYADAWITGQRVWALPGYNSVDTDLQGGLQEWTVFLRRAITGTGKTDLQTEPGGGGSLDFNHSGLWRWDLTATCYDSDINITAGTQPAFAVWESKGIYTVRDWDNTNAARQSRLFVDGTEASPTLVNTASITPGHLIAENINGATPETTWVLTIEPDATNSRLRVSVTSSADDNLHCNARVNVIEMRNE